MSLRSMPCLAVLGFTRNARAAAVGLPGCRPADAYLLWVLWPTAKQCSGAQRWCSGPSDGGCHLEL